MFQLLLDSEESGGKLTTLKSYIKILQKEQAMFGQKQQQEAQANENYDEIKYTDENGEPERYVTPSKKPFNMRIIGSSRKVKTFALNIMYK